MTERVSHEKPLGHKSYGSIPHLPGSRQGRDDVGVSEQTASLCLIKTRNRHDEVIVQEKLDGSNVAVANVGGQLLALCRAGWLAQTSKYNQHQLFAYWLRENEHLFRWLPDGSRVCGEWLAQAHGTRYNLSHGPFVAFDIMRGHDRIGYEYFRNAVSGLLPIPKLLHRGGALSIKEADVALGEYGHHGAIDRAEGVVYRFESRGKVLFLAKYVRPDKVDGKYLPEVSGVEPVWNWTVDCAGRQG